MWQPDQELLETALETIEAERRALERGGGLTEASSLLEALGTTVGLDRADEGRRAASATSKGTWLEALRGSLAKLELAELDDAAAVILELAPRCLTLDPEEFDQLQPLLDALRTRDRVELLWLGAESLGITESLSDEAAASRLAFDEVIAPELWQLLPLGEARTTELEWMTPSLRPRFWWRARGSELPSSALHEPHHFQRVLRIFPEARERLDAFLATMPRTERCAEVVDLRAFLSRKRDAHLRDAQGRPRAAAAAHGADEVPLVRTGSVEVGLRGETLLVDVVADLAPGARPALVCAGRRRDFDSVPETNQRFAITPQEIELAATDARVVVPLLDRTEELSLADERGP